MSQVNSNDPELEKLKKDAKDNQFTINLVEKYYEARIPDQMRINISFGLVEYFLALHNRFKEENNVL